jgi:hypothetical protein
LPLPRSALFARGCIFSRCRVVELPSILLSALPVCVFDDNLRAESG